jgi:hypothetical protein
MLAESLTTVVRKPLILLNHFAGAGGFIVDPICGMTKF